MLSTLTKIKAGAFGTLALIMLFLWAFGGLIGAIIEATRDNLLGVVLAIFIPGWGAVITVLAVFGVQI